MKKVFMILGASLLAALVVVSCNKPATNNNNNEQKPDNNNETPDPNKPGGGEKEEFSLDVAIDGDFSEWDKLTDETADGEYYLYDENTDAENNGVLRVKFTSDEDYIYMYTELLFENIALSDAEKGAIGFGDCNNGYENHGAIGTHGALIIYVGGDGDDNKLYAARSYGEEDSMWDYKGFDAFPQYYFAYDSSRDVMQFGWQQNNCVVPEEDHWGEPLSAHGAGWIADTPDHDSDVTGEQDIKFSGVVKVTDPVSKKEVEVIKIELSMDREGILKIIDGGKVNNEAVLGVFYEQVGHVSQQTDSQGAGKLPSGNKALTLKLK